MVPLRQELINAFHNTTVLALVLSIIGNIIGGCGYILQKKAHNNTNAQPRQEQKSFTTNPLWILGFFIYACGSIMHGTALAYGPQTLLQPMESFCLITNAVLAPVFLDEYLTFQDVVSIGVIIIGVSVVVIFGPHSTVQHDAQHLLRRFLVARFLLYTFCGQQLRAFFVYIDMSTCTRNIPIAVSNTFTT